MKFFSDFKHFIIAAVALVCSAFGASAQSDECPFVDTSRPDQFIQLGVHVGDGISTLRQNYSEVVSSVSDFILTPGNRFDIGLTAIVPIRNFFAIGTGLDFTANNYYWTMMILNRSQGTLSSIYSRNRYYDIEIPAYLQFRFNLGSKVQWRWDLGMFVAFGIGGDSKANVVTSSTNDLGQSQVTETSINRKYYNEEAPLVNAFGRTNLGLRLATGIVAYKHYTFDAVFDVGISQLAENMGALDVSARSMSLTFKVGYLF